MDVQTYRQELSNELQDILYYWTNNTVDNLHAGFYGSVDNDNIAKAGAPKGVVLNARILWTFSAASNFLQDKKYLAIAARAYDYLLHYFTDKECGGVFWSVDAEGSILNSRKQVYGLAFYLYGLSEYYLATNEKGILDQAVALFQLIEEKSFDTKGKGYFEAFARDWTALADLRLSAKDANEKKTMNTHLHIIEAYANLYKAWPDELLKKRILQLLEVFDEYMIDRQSHHLILFFNEEWKAKPDVISYGHDIEAGWLLQQCAEVINDVYWIGRMKQQAILITNAAMEGLDSDGGLWYEYNPAQEKWTKEKHWWEQAEAMVGFYNAYQVSGERKFLDHSMAAWQFTKAHILDKNKGEWYWGIKEDYSLMPGEDKAGFWKCPYHNARACMEIIRRIDE
jgi:mannobiose 2-epimerase